jgi:hypothetical protein
MNHFTFILHKKTYFKYEYNLGTFKKQLDWTNCQIIESFGLQGENGGQLQDFDGIVEAREVK